MTRHFLNLNSMGKQDLLRVLDRAAQLKATRGEVSTALKGKSVALVFEKASTRTHLSLDVAVTELGGHPIYLGTSTQVGRGEPMADTARVLSGMVHGITLRTYAQSRLLELAEHSRVPVLNALTDLDHPMQLLADLMTVRGARGELAGLRYAWIGDGNNMANSWIEAAGLLGLSLTLACPEGYDPDAATLEQAKAAGADVQVVREPKAAARNADVISTDVFTSMGQEKEKEIRAKAFAGMQVNRELLAVAKSDVMILHCLPAHRGEEIEAEVIDGPNSHVWDQAEARLHTAKAALEWALGADG